MAFIMLSWWQLWIAVFDPMWTSLQASFQTVFGRWIFFGPLDSPTFFLWNPCLTWVYVLAYCPTIYFNHHNLGWHLAYLFQVTGQQIQVGHCTVRWSRPIRRVFVVWAGGPVQAEVFWREHVHRNMLGTKNEVKVALAWRSEQTIATKQWVILVEYEIWFNKCTIFEIYKISKLTTKLTMVVWKTNKFRCRPKKAAGQVGHCRRFGRWRWSPSVFRPNIGLFRRAEWLPKRPIVGENHQKPRWCIQ